MDPTVTDFSFTVIEAGQLLASVKIWQDGENISATMFCTRAQASEPWHTSPRKAVQSAARFVGEMLPPEMDRYQDNAEDFTRWLLEHKHINDEEHKQLLKLVA